MTNTERDVLWILVGYNAATLIGCVLGVWA